MAWQDLHRYRYRLWLAAFVQVGVLAGATYGWPNLAEVLERAGYYADDDDSDTEFGLIYTVGSWFNQGGRLFVGIYLDYFGVKVTTATGCFMSAAGLALLCISSPDTNLLYPAFILISLGGPALQLSTQSVSKLFVNRAMVMASLTWAFQLSTLWFLLINVLNEGGISDKLLYAIYAGGACVLAVQCLWIWPKTFDTAESVGDGKTPGASHGHGHARKSMLTSTGRYPSDFLETASLWQMMRTPDYIFLNVWYSAYILYLQWYVMTVGTQTEKYTGDSMSVQFGIVLCTFSATAIGSGWAIDKVGFAIPTLGNIGISIVALWMFSSSSEFVQWIGFGLYVLSRVTTYGMFFAFIGINFGFRHFGTLAGVGLLLSAFFSLFQYFCLNLVENTSDDDYAAMNDFFMVWNGAFGGVYAMWLAKQEFSLFGGGESSDALATDTSRYVINSDGTKAATGPRV